MTLRLVFLACLSNAAMGVLYVWSLFLLPLEAALGTSRSGLSLIPACALVAFTLGMVLHDRLLRMLGFRAFSLLAFGLAGGGHLVFAAGGSLVTLFIGYGLLFGLGAGLGYGLALALVTRLPDAVRSLGLGLAMAAFAVSGVALSGLFAGPIRDGDPAYVFLIIGIAIVLTGLVVTALLPVSRPVAVAEEVRALPLLRDVTDPKFLRLALIFFFICYTGLMVVAHLTGIVLAQGGTARLAGLAPGVFTFGYILGSLAGGRLVELSSGRTMLILSNLLAGAGLVTLLLPAPPLALAGALAVGMVFGGSASLMPVLIGGEFGTERTGGIYGRLMLAFGAAGLVAPPLSGRLFAAAGSYIPALGIGVAMCAAGMALGMTMKPEKSGG
ncbi:MFS transporter [Pseudogemmobacter humi]|uniref:Major Facilitator Superfamily protein n=1 Tax=Pseudogemmobacter humi TaxID=2483812 RepID=A0A3P5WSS0_9RHOB|nr:MFS transporter [Pseudogemmobacter humi]VDC22351.1 Major Facilitator Superfamily protein [Pseudogemmobacter humi]